MSDISKRFGDSIALQGATLTIEPGRVHAIVGENGAGKSTLIKILSGGLRPDTGEVRINGQQVSFADPVEARRAGVGVVHQHFSLHPSLSVVESMSLADPDGGFFVRPSRVRERLLEVAREAGIEIDPNAIVANLSYGQRQKLEILRLLYCGARILLLDEPTAVLTPVEAEDVLSQMRRLAQGGRTIVLVTHRLREAKLFAEVATVLRRGRVIGTVAMSTCVQEQLMNMMFGEAPLAQLPPARSTPGEILLSAESLSLRDISRRAVVDSVSLTLRRGEILGIAGIAGNGQDQLLRLLGGLASPTAGSLRFERRLDTAPGRDIAFIPADRLGLGVVPDMSVERNLVLRSFRLRRFRAGPFVRHRAIRRWAKRCIHQSGIVAPSPIALVSSLSGGNVQKLIVARELATDPQVIIAEEPTNGLDAASAMRVQRLLLDRVAAGAGAIIASSDLDELVELCTKVLIMRGGRIVGSFGVRRDQGADALVELRALIAIAMTSDMTVEMKDRMNEHLKEVSICRSESSMKGAMI